MPSESNRRAYRALYETVMQQIDPNDTLSHSVQVNELIDQFDRSTIIHLLGKASAFVLLYAQQTRQDPLEVLSLVDSDS